MGRPSSGNQQGGHTGDINMDLKEKERRLIEKSTRRPINNIILDVQRGMIDIQAIFRRIAEKIQEKK